MKSSCVYSDDSASYDEDEYDQLNNATFGSGAMHMNPKGFSFNAAETKYRVEIKGEDIDAVTKSMNDKGLCSVPEVVNFKNLSLDKTSKKDDELSPKKVEIEEDGPNCKPSIVDHFFLWINPQQLYMLSDLHNMNCRKNKLFNYTHIIPTLEDKMLNRIKLKFHASKYLFGVDIASLVQMFQRKLAESSHLIPFNCDYYYWEHRCRLYPNVPCINRMLIVDDMWLPPVTSALELDSPRPQLPQTKAVRPPTIKYEDSLGSVSLSSVQFPRKLLSCDSDNNLEVNKIYNPDLFSDIQKRYYVLSIIDRAIRLVIDYEIKNRVVSCQIQNQQKVEYKPEEMLKFQMVLGDFNLKIIPLYPFILNYNQGIKLFTRVFYFLSDIHKVHVSKGIFEALKSDKIEQDQYSKILNNDCLVNVIMFGLGDTNEINNHMTSLDFFSKIETIKFESTLLFWRFLEMILAWLIPLGYNNGNIPPPEYTLKFLCVLPTALKVAPDPTLSPFKINLIHAAQQKIFAAIKGTNFKRINTPITKKIVYAKETILNNCFRPKRFH